MNRPEGSAGAEVEVLSESLPGLSLEAVASPANDGHLLLETWNGHKSGTAPRVEHAGRVYVPRSPLQGLARWVRFSPPSRPYGSAEKLLALIRECWSRYTSLPPDTVDFLIAFAIASWFCDRTSVAPVLYLLGPDAEVSRILRLLGCCCRRPLLLGDVDFESLTSLPPELGATFLINQRGLGRNVKRVLLASNRRQFCIIRGKRRLEFYGAKALSCEDYPAGGNGFTLAISPSRDSKPLTDLDEQAIAAEFQPILLRYRMSRYLAVRETGIDCSNFVPEVREQAVAWLAPIAGCPELKKTVEEALLRQSEEAAQARFSDSRQLVIESALFFCHKSDVSHFFVNQLAEQVNALLTGRHEETQVTAKKVGIVLREIGLSAERVTEGYRVTLSDIIRKRIHRLAGDYQVLSTLDHKQRCPDCPPAERATCANKPPGR